KEKGEGRRKRRKEKGKRGEGKKEVREGGKEGDGCNQAEDGRRELWLSRGHGEEYKRQLLN
ncbi:hypothetical protein, partial [Escherichia coli]|uniref:hypothetical protein n=1 Tax=Escherichia coli TaxID=562 RepID=UPI0038B35937